MLFCFFNFLNCRFNWFRFYKGSNWMRNSKGNCHLSVIFEVTTRNHNFLHLVSCCRVEIDVPGFKVLKRVFRQNWRFKCGCFHPWFEEVSKVKCRYSIIISYIVCFLRQNWFTYFKILLFLLFLSLFWGLLFFLFLFWFFLC